MWVQVMSADPSPPMRPVAWSPPALHRAVLVSAPPDHAAADVEDREQPAEHPGHVAGAPHHRRRRDARRGRPRRRALAGRRLTEAVPDADECGAGDQVQPGDEPP